MLMNIKKYFIFGLFLACTQLFADSEKNAQHAPYSGDGVGVEIELISPDMGLAEGMDKTLVFVDPSCITCRRMFKELDDCKQGDHVEFVVVASTLQTLESIDDKLWYLSSGGNLPSSNFGCQEDCTNYKKMTSPTHVLGDDMPNIDKLMRNNKLARNIAIWRKFSAEEHQATPSYLHLNDMKSGLIKDSIQAKEIVGCV